MGTRQSTGGLGQQVKVKRSASAAPLKEIPSLTASGSEMASIDAPSSHSSVTNRKIHWRLGVLAALAMALLSLYPQIDLWITRGANWQGSYTSLFYDDAVYAGYINRLLLGRPRTSQPLGVTNPEKPPYESLFSIQVVPAYLIVLLARTFGLTAVQAFIMLAPLMAFLSTLMLFYLLASISRDEGLAALGALAVLIFGTLAARQSVDFLFLRLYQPAIVFPIFLGFIALTWQAFIREGRQAWLAASAAGAVFVVLIFSYLYLWTAAAAWLACFVLVWLVARYAEWPKLAKRLAPTALFGSAALAVYAALLHRRDPAMDKILVATFTHAPDLYRAPQFISVVSILLLLWGVKQGRVQWRQPVVILASSLALMPFVVFNQQIIMGRSLQPIHYELFIANYVSLLAVIFIAAIIWGGRELQLTRRLPKLMLAGLACVVFGWGVADVRGMTLAHKLKNTDRDLFVPVTKRLAALAAEHGKGPNDREVVFLPDIGIGPENIATSAPQVPLSGIHMLWASGLPIEELQERYYQYLYYHGVSPGSLARALTHNDIMAIATLLVMSDPPPSWLPNQSHSRLRKSRRRCVSMLSMWQASITSVPNTLSFLMWWFIPIPILISPTLIAGTAVMRVNGSAHLLFIKSNHSTSRT